MEHSNESPTPPQVLLQLMMGTWVSQTVGSLARLRVFDALAQGPQSAAAVAERLALDPDALYRAMRAAAMIGVLAESGPRSFALTPVGQLLRSDVPGSMRALLDAETAPGHWLPWARLDECIRTGRTQAEAALGMDVWEYYSRNAAEGRAFSEGMSGFSMMALGAMSAAWQPPPCTKVVDVGGAYGALLGFVLGAHQTARGVLFDLPHVIDAAGATLEAAGVASRTERVAGDFRKSVPAGGDLYLLKHILHDWDDATCRVILSNVRASMAPGATVAVVEMMLPDDATPSPAKLLDLNMLVMLPGRERTVEEMRVLHASAGLTITRVVPTPSPFIVYESRAS